MARRDWGSCLDRDLGLHDALRLVTERNLPDSTPDSRELAFLLDINFEIRTWRTETAPLEGTSHKLLLSGASS